MSKNKESGLDQCGAEHFEVQPELNAFVDSFLSQSEKKCGTERVNVRSKTVCRTTSEPQMMQHWVRDYVMFGSLPSQIRLSSVCRL